MKPERQKAREEKGERDVAMKVRGRRKVWEGQAEGKVNEEAASGQKVDGLLGGDKTKWAR